MSRRIRYVAVVCLGVVSFGCPPRTSVDLVISEFVVIGAKALKLPAQVEVPVRLSVQNLGTDTANSSFFCTVSEEETCGPDELVLFIVPTSVRDTCLVVPRGLGPGETHTFVGHLVFPGSAWGTDVDLTACVDSYASRCYAPNMIPTTSGLVLETNEGNNDEDILVHIGS